MHVLVISSEPFDYPESPLLGIFQRHQAEALSEAGVVVGVLAPQPRSLRYAAAVIRDPRRLLPPRGAHRFPVLRPSGWDLFPRLPRLQRRVYLASGKRLFARYLKRHGRPDLLHAHNTLPAGELASVLSMQHGIPFVITEHSSRFLTQDFGPVELERIPEIHRRARTVLAVSRRLQRQIDPLANGAIRTRIVPNLLPPEVEARAPELNPPPASPVTFLCVAGLVPIKDHALLLRSFARAFGGDGSARLRIAGGGPLREALTALAGRLGVGDQVTFTGALARVQVLEELARASCVVLSSRHETFGVALIEAMYFGRPVISTRCGGPEDVIEPWFGSLVDLGDEGGYAVAMRQLRDRLPSLPVRRIHEHCVARYGRKAFTETICGVYEDALRTSQATRTQP